ncbi:unnamed protein product [Trifolium pratense]|uniref:Uncharacterized protein n=1 Tax=Trifolium pratense TaxID=57577 RepID=A0ACB0KK77_TRIPR|nr:unnamed protein product [Trifolium pratense]
MHFKAEITTPIFFVNATYDSWQLKSNLSPLSKVDNETIMMSDAGLLSNTLALDAIHDIVPSHVINVTALFLCLLYLVNDPKVVYGVRLKCSKMSYEPSFA